LGIQLSGMDEEIKSRLFAVRHKLATAGVGVLLFVIGYHVVFGVNGVIAYQHKRRESKELQQQIELLQQQNERVQEQIKALKYDPQAIEKEAREHLRYARPGEMIYTLPAAKPGVAPATTQKHP